MDNIWLESAVEAYRKYFGDTANIIIDIGTRDGDDAEYFRQKLNGKKIYAFDANPLAVSETKKRYPNFNVIESAVGSFNGQTSFTKIISENIDEAGCSSMEVIHIFDNVKYEKIIVSITRLDSFLAEQELSGVIVDIIKIDTEGFSWEVLMGMGDVLKNVRLLHVETEMFNRHPGHKNNVDIYNYLTNNNFVCVDKSYEWGPTIEDQVWVNQRFM
jgi:FkbM family methyltransferase